MLKPATKLRHCSPKSIPHFPLPCGGRPVDILLRRTAAVAARRDEPHTGFRRLWSPKKESPCSVPRLRLRPCTTAAGGAQGSSPTGEEKATVEAVVTVANLPGSWPLVDKLTDLIGRTLHIELISAQLDPDTGVEKDTVEAYAHIVSQDAKVVTLEASFRVPVDFGQIGGVYVTNEHHKELFLNDIVLTAAGSGGAAAATTTITCRSWVHSKSDDQQKRIFFTNKSYLPAQTPGGLLGIRSRELEALRGDGVGERKTFERIYDYDTYNDLGNPDVSQDLSRPVLGASKQYPYPRRCRTGRSKSKADPNSETRSLSIYVPRDEEFSDIKSATFDTTTLKYVLHALIPSIPAAVVDVNQGFSSFTDIDTLYTQGFKVPDNEGLLENLKDAVSNLADEILLFEAPDMFKRDKFSWLRDEEFARQTLAGTNPLVIELVREFPLMSKLDPQTYGPPESAITAEMIEQGMDGAMTVEEAIEQRRLFMLDYHDLFLPFVNKVRELKHTTLYGSRTVFFLGDDGALRPLAIELTRPLSVTKPQWKKVFRPSSDATENWLWRLARTHVAAHDSAYHELVSHWLRTHCCLEPYVIAANRQLSAMHPIYRLLHPHFRYTMKINALARQYLISAAGIIELSFSTLKYCMEISSTAYDQLWRFDMEALPADLVRRGMAVEDPMSEHGLRLTIEDYPFANDGLMIWTAIEQWVHSYVSHYYPSLSDMAADYELQEWWNEVRTKGHADKKDEPWWPKLESVESLTRTLTTIIWVASAHHSAVNFGQYAYGGYFPNRPTIARNNVPQEDVPDEGDAAEFMEKPEATLLECFPSQLQAAIVMAVLYVLSEHSPDEEYLGGTPERPWPNESEIESAYATFTARLKEIEGVIAGRNSDHGLKNRSGAGVIPYEIMKPFSEPGVTGMGIPNSTSI